MSASASTAFLVEHWLFGLTGRGAGLVRPARGWNDGAAVMTAGHAAGYLRARALAPRVGSRAGGLARLGCGPRRVPRGRPGSVRILRTAQWTRASIFFLEVCL